MRKGFLLTLTALVSAFMVTSAMAMGPTISGVPDVYIGAEDEAGTYQNMFRYTDALTLWQYVTPGVTSGDGSSSDTLYWAWAAKDADLSGGTGSYLNPANINYSIIQENGTEALLLTPTHETTDPAIGAEINAALAATGSSLPDYSLAAAGQLTFRNIRLSPLPDANYTTPTATAGLPAHYLDLQEATLYVSDTTTTDLGTDKILLATIDSTINGGNDFLSGGLKFSMEEDLSGDTSAFTSLGLNGTADYTYAGAVNPAEVVLTKTATSVSIGTPIDNGTANGGQAQYKYGLWLKVTNSLTPGNLYRAEMSVASTNATVTANPHLILGLNSRTKAGFGFVEVLAGSGATPVNGSPVTLSGYLVPSEADSPQVNFAVYDPDTPNIYGGTMTASNIRVETIPLADVLGTATADPVINSFTVGTDPNTVWTFFGVPYGGSGVTAPTFTHTPTSGTGAELVMTGQTSTTNTNNVGFASFQGPNTMFNFTVGKLAILRCKVSSTTALTNKLPSMWLNIESPSSQPGLILDRDNAGTNGPTSTAKDYYLVFEPKDATGKFNLRILCDTINVNGNIHLSELQLYQADVPSEP